MLPDIRGCRAVDTRCGRDLFGLSFEGRVGSEGCVKQQENDTYKYGLADVECRRGAVLPRDNINC